jgi:hypothetical protein
LALASMPQTISSEESANTACPLSRRIRAADAFGFTSHCRCVTMVLGCSTFFRFVRGGVGHANPLDAHQSQ